MSSSRSLLSLNLPKETLAALTRSGYESIQDLKAADPNTLVNELNLSLSQVEQVLNLQQSTPLQPSTIPTLTQSAALMVQSCPKVSTNCSALDNLLDGGLMRGHILEISGPPGSPKEKLAINIIKSFADAGHEALVADCAGMMLPAVLGKALGDLQRRIYHTKLQSLPELLLFLHQLPSILASRTNVSLLVINSISFPFQNPDLSVSQKSSALDRVKQSFSKACASNNLTILTTSQLATKMINPDGTKGSYDTGGRGIMLPQLGPAYLPNRKTFRVLLTPKDPTYGFLKLLSSPKFPPGKAPLVVEAYAIVGLMETLDQKDTDP